MGDPSTPADIIRSAADGLAAAATDHLDHWVPRYPGWRVRNVVLHTGSVHRRVATLVRNRAREPNQREDWRGRVNDDALLDWFNTGVSELLASLAAAPAELAVWYFGRLAPVDAWRQRMANETVIHRWDVESASGTPAAIPAGLAAAGLREAVALYMVRLVTDVPLEEGRSLHLAPTDVDAGIWLVGRGGRLELAEEPLAQKATCTLSGSAADLWLWCIGRRELAELQVDGARDVAERLTAHIAAIDTPAY